MTTELLTAVEKLCLMAAKREKVRDLENLSGRKYNNLDKSYKMAYTGNTTDRENDRFASRDVGSEFSLFFGSGEKYTWAGGPPGVMLTAFGTEIVLPAVVLPRRLKPR